MGYLYALLAILTGLSMIYDTIYIFFLREPFDDLPKWTLTSFCFSWACCFIAWAIRWIIWKKVPWE